MVNITQRDKQETAGTNLSQLPFRLTILPDDELLLTAIASRYMGYDQDMEILKALFNNSKSCVYTLSDPVSMNQIIIKIKGTHDVGLALNFNIATEHRTIIEKCTNQQKKKDPNVLDHQTINEHV